MDHSKTIVENILAHAGISVNGNQPWDITVYDERLYGRVLAQGSLGLGEGYMDGWWECPALDQFFYKLGMANINNRTIRNLKTAFFYLHSKLVNMQTKARAKKVARQHFDLSPELFMSFLDPYNQYTCGYFKNTTDLNIAQEQKLDLICKKLQLTSNDRVLDIGCGWGGFAKFASERYGCHVTGITISDEQVRYSQVFTKGLAGVTIRKCDYRDLGKERFDKILICGMIEHVGYKNYRTIMNVVRKHLADDGLFLLHTIGSNISSTALDPWMDRYIFPNTMIPSLTQLTRASEGLFVVEDLHSFGVYYDPTLMAWFKNFENNWPTLAKKFNERFHRTWKFYFLSCAGGFRARNLQLWQFVFSKTGIAGGYTSVR